MHESLNVSFKLYCRDSKRLLIQVERSDDGHVENKTFIYLLIIQETKSSFPDRMMYMVSFKSFTFAFRTFFLSLPPKTSNWTWNEIEILIVLILTSNSIAHFFYCQSDEPLIELRDLKPSESYNISATIVSSSYDVQNLGTQIFTTLKSDYKPESVKDIWVQEYKPIEGDGERVDAVIGWNPARGERITLNLLCNVN